MQYQIGDKVFHPIHGIGKIVAIKEKALNGDVPSLYYEVAMSNSRMWVMVHPLEEGRLRHITPRSDMERYHSLLKSRPVPLENNYRQRQNDLITRFKSGTLQDLCEIVRDLRARKTLRVLSEFDSTLLTRASDYLFDEWAAINEISRYEASRDVEALLVEGQSSL